MPVGGWLEQDWTNSRLLLELMRICCAAAQDDEVCGPAHPAGYNSPPHTTLFLPVLFELAKSPPLQ